MHGDIFEKFAAGFASAIAELGVGNGSPTASRSGRGAATGIGRLVEEAVAGGATVVHRSDVPAGEGSSYYPPTPLVDVPETAELLNEEIFGPGRAPGVLAGR